MSFIAFVIFIQTCQINQFQLELIYLAHLCQNWYQSRMRSHDHRGLHLIRLSFITCPPPSLSAFPFSAKPQKSLQTPNPDVRDPKPYLTLNLSPPTKDHANQGNVGVRRFEWDLGTCKILTPLSSPNPFIHGPQV